MSGVKWISKTPKNHNKFSKECKYQNLPFKTYKNMLKNLAGLSNILKMPSRIKLMSLEDLSTQDKYSLIMKAQMLKCISSLLSYMNSKTKVHFLEFIQK